MWRDVFLYSNNPEVYLDLGNVRDLLPEIGNETAGLDAQLKSLRSSSEKNKGAWFDLLSSLDADIREDVVRVVLEQTAPTAAAAGVALQCLSAPSVFEDPPHLRLMTLLADDLGAGAAEQWRFDTFRDIARQYDATSVTGSLGELSDHRGIRDGCYRLPATIYAMSRRCESLDYELIGIDLAWRTVGLLPMWDALRTDETRWARLDLGQATGAALPKGGDAAAFARAIVDTICHDPDVAVRISRGIALFAVLLEELDELMRTIVASVGNPRLAMAILVQDRAREARVYHGSFMLEGRALSDWFNEAQTDPMPLVDALGRSKLVRPGQPNRSLLTNGLIREGGAMFRIFSPSDIQLMQRWINSLQDVAVDVPLPSQISVRSDPRKVKGGDLALGSQPTDVRMAYHMLQGRALPPRTRDFAKAYSAFWLNQSHGSVDADNRSLPETWRPGALREWLLSEHDAHASAFELTSIDAVPSREALIDQTLQLAPLTLIDGAWLQGYTEASLASSRVGAPLFETYWDELGNGDWAINHPKIYRDVLAAMEITLPPTGSRAFVQDNRLRDGSFRLPVYWLCLGKFPVSLRPEILGMNLAMELSGVGGSYRDAHRFLQHYGFPTIFVDLHNTIDNVSTGHSAWAADAIDAYMQTTQDVVAPKQSWDRIRLGYASLAPIVGDQAHLDYFAATESGTTADAADWHFHHAPLQRQEAVE